MDSLSAQLLTDPYTALHDATEQAVYDAGCDVRALVRDVLAHSPDPGHDTNTAAGREAITSLIGEALAPLVARYAHAITGVQTLRALLNAGTLEFSMAGTVKRMSELLEKVVDLADSSKWDEADTHTFMLAAIEAGKQARELLDDFRDAQPAADQVRAVAATVGSALDADADQTDDDDEAANRHYQLEHAHQEQEAAEVAEATERRDEAGEAFEADPAVVAGDEAITVAVDAPNNPGEDADPDQADRVGFVLAEAGGDAVNALSAEEGRRRKEAAAEIKRGRAAVSYLAPFYEVYRADTGRQAPHCTTPTYDAALSYCRASHGTPWHILEVNDQGEALLVTDVKIDGTVVELTDRLPPFQVAEPEPAQPPEGMQQMVRELAAGVWFTVRRSDDPTGGDFCRTPHYQLALEYCQGSPGVPWAIWQAVNGSTVIVTTVDEAGDVTEVSERGAS